jgi:tetratricopeptide (TPR) repeat protein
VKRRFPFAPRRCVSIPRPPREDHHTSRKASRRIGEQSTWTQHRARLGAALDEAAAAARTGDDLLAVATVAAKTAHSERTARLANEALRRGIRNPDSARVLIAGSWDFELLFSDTIPPSRLRAMLAVTDTLIGHRPARAGIYAYRAQVLSRLSRGVEAVAAARRSVDLGRADSTSGWYWTVYHHVTAKHGTAADDDAVFARMREAGQADSYDWSEHGSHLKARERWAEAAEAYAQAFRVDPQKSGRFACSAGQAYWAAEQLDRALDGLRTCVQAYASAAYVDTNQVVYAHRAIASILNDRGVPAQAEMHAREARALNPEDAWAAYELSRALLEQERATEAAVMAEAAVRLSDGASSAMHFAAGSAYFKLNEWSKCARAFERAAELNTGDVAAPYNVGLCLSRQGFYKDAARWMETALRRNPGRADRAQIEEMIRTWRR